MSGIRKKLVIFDMDGVLTQHPSSWKYVHDRIGVDNEKNYELFKSRKISYDQFLESDVKLWTGRYDKLTERDVRKLLDEIPLRENLKESMETLRQKGALLCIISGGISWLSDRINQVFKFDLTLSNSIRTDGNGVILPMGDTMVNPLEKGAVLERVQHDLSVTAEDTVSVGDSVQDIPMFRRSQFSVGFNPLDEQVSGSSTVSLRSNNLLDLAEIIERKCFQ